MPKRNVCSDNENQIFAPYAMRSCNSRGRVYKEQEHAYRSAYQRDRDRVIHSAAFRRLEYKTQVFVNHEGDYYRTRLTHTLEVAQIARTIAYALKLNIDLTEAIALAHDLGHTPFGHSGEEALNELMARHGGFNHNLQSLRVVDLLEEKYPDFPGLNLTWEVREGIVKHSSVFDKAGSFRNLAPRERPTLEAQIVDIADEIAYDNHDLDDGITSGLINQSELERLEIWGNIYQGISQRYPKKNPEIIKYLIINSLINLQVTDLIRQIKTRISSLKIKSVLDIKKLDKKIATFSSEMQRLRRPLRAFLMDRLYRHYRVIRMSEKAKHFIKQLFQVYTNKPRGLPAHIQEKIHGTTVRRVVCDYIAGMTDRYALDEYKKLFDPYEKV
jgi:dGTPase